MRTSCPILALTLLCSCNGGASFSSSVDDTLRNACYWLDDQGIDDRIYLTEVGRDAGASELEMLAAWGEVCTQEVSEISDFVGLDIVDMNQLQADCGECFLRMVQRVY